MKIFKYPLQAQLTQTLQLPSGATLLTVENQNEQLMLWAIVDSDKALVNRTIRVVMTGEEFDSGRCEYIGTFQYEGFVGHVFEEFNYNIYGLKVA